MVNDINSLSKLSKVDVELKVIGDAMYGNNHINAKVYILQVVGINLETIVMKTNL